MLPFLLRRLLALGALAAGMVVVVFGLMQVVPGDPAVVLLGENATPEAVTALREELGLDRPLPVQLARYVSGLLQGELGQSIFQGRPVAEAILERLPATLELATAALLLAIAIGLSLGVVSALDARSPLAVAAAFFAQLSVAMPVFWLGILLMAIVSVELRWLPAVGRGAPLLDGLLALAGGEPAPIADSIRHLLLPALTLSLASAAVIQRLTRRSLLGTLGETHVLAARARGLSERRITLGYALRSALPPVVQVIGLRFGTLLGGAVLTESIFGWPGIGQLVVTAISQRDLPLVQGILLVFAMSFALLNFGVDVLLGLLDPRIRTAGGSSNG